jgi:hypothetical protein
MPGNESQPPEANEHNSHLLKSQLGLINSTKYDGGNPNCATVGSSGHATGVPRVVTKGSKIVRKCVATLLGLTTK